MLITTTLDDIANTVDNYEQACIILDNLNVSKRDISSGKKYLQTYYFPPSPPMNKNYHKAFECDESDYIHNETIDNYFLKYIDTPRRYDRYPVLVISGLNLSNVLSTIRSRGPHLHFNNSVDINSFINIPNDCRFVVMDHINKNVDDVLGNKALILAMEDGWTHRFPRKGCKKVENMCTVIWLCDKSQVGFIDPSCDKYYGRSFYRSNSWYVEFGDGNEEFIHRTITTCAGERIPY